MSEIYCSVFIRFIFNCINNTILPNKTNSSKSTRIVLGSWDACQVVGIGMRTASIPSMVQTKLVIATSLRYNAAHSHLQMLNRIAS